MIFLKFNEIVINKTCFSDSLGLNYNGTINVTETKVQLMDKLSKSIKREDDVLYLVVMQVSIIMFYYYLL